MKLGKLVDVTDNVRGESFVTDFYSVTLKNFYPLASKTEPTAEYIFTKKELYRALDRADEVYDQENLGDKILGGFTPITYPNPSGRGFVTRVSVILDPSELFVMQSKPLAFLFARREFLRAKDRAQSGLIKRNWLQKLWRRLKWKTKK